MTLFHAAMIVGAGLAAGAINTIVGSGSLVTFPTLVALGYPPVVANIANTIGLVPGSASGAVAYRRELVGQRGRVIRLGAAAALGGLTGGILLLTLPPSAFDRVVPVLILLACVLVALQPRLSRALAARHGPDSEGSRLLPLLVYATAIYGGYFGAAQSVILIAILGVFIPDDLQRLNGLKNVLAFIVNGVAAVLFITVARVSWEPAVLIAAGSIMGGQVGAHVGRRLSPMLLRGAIIVVGTVVAVRLLVG
ncbi:MAG: sulfite exporter TauE/SafE family protein [Candidatus Limnocylindrales bacterium]